VERIVGDVSEQGKERIHGVRVRRGVLSEFTLYHKVKDPLCRFAFKIIYQ